VAIKKKIVFSALTGKFDLITKGLDATAIAVVPTGTISSTELQAALAELDSEKQALSEKGAANGYVPLNASSKIPNTYLPALAITDTFVVASQAAMLALSTAETGDIAVRTDLNKTFILQGTTFSVLADWQELLTPTDTVLSVNGQTGAVVLAATDVGAISALTGDVTASGSGSVAATLATVNSNVGTFGSATQVASLTVNAKGLVTGVANSNIQIAESQVTNLVSDLALKAPLASPALTGVPTAPTAAPATNTTQIATTEFVTTAVSAVSSGANASLSNLTTTSINQDLSPSANLARTFGTTSLQWLRGYITKISSTAGDQIDVANRALQFNGSNVASWFSNGFQFASSKLLRFTDTGSVTTGIKSADTATASIDYALPASPPTVSGQVLASTTAGVMGWTSARAVAPTQQIFTSGSGTYNRPANCVRIRVRMVGGGGGGAAGGTSTLAGNNGANTTFGAATCNGGQGAPSYIAGNTLGQASVGPYVGWGVTGGQGGQGLASSASLMYASGGVGGGSFFGSGGQGGTVGSGETGYPPGTGGGGGTGNNASSRTGGGGGQAGGFVEFTISNPASTYSYAVGAGGAIVISGGLGGGNGAPGAPGLIIVDEEY